MPKQGYITASSFDKLMSNGRKEGEIGKTAYSVVDKLVLDLLNVEIEEITAPALEWGKHWEWSAIEAYQDETMRTVLQPEFRVSPDLDYVGGTMDGLVGEKLGGVEVKCPYDPINHIAREDQQKNYKWQLQGYMWIYELEWIDFISFDPRYPEDKQIIIERIYRNNEDIEKLKERCEWAHKEALKKVEEVKTNIFKN